MEKTFEELIEEKMMTNFTEEHREDILFLKGKSIIDLMQQVREATIAECANIVHHSEGIYDNLNELQGKNVSYLDFKYLLTDRIII